MSLKLMEIKGMPRFNQHNKSLQHEGNPAVKTNWHRHFTEMDAMKH